MSQALSKIAEQTAPLGVKSLQKGLNDLYANEYKKSPLKEDDVLGPKTTSRIKEALANFGMEEVEKKIRLGGLSSFLENNRKRQVDNASLKNTMDCIRPKDSGSFLQRGLNELGAGLKEDNDIGPKTTASFNQIKDEKEDDLRQYFRRNWA